MAHIVIFAGAIERGAPIRYDRAGAERLRDGLMRRERKQAIGFGTVRWGGRPAVST